MLPFWKVASGQIPKWYCLPPVLKITRWVLIGYPFGPWIYHVFITAVQIQRSQRAKLRAQIAGPNFSQADFWPAWLFYVVQLPPISRHQAPFVVRAWSARAAHMAATTDSWSVS